jgi:hypothetical protein
MPRAFADISAADSYYIMPETSISPPAVTRPSKPVSEALLNEKVPIPNAS